jgi:hypothetical protein
LLHPLHLNADSSKSAPVVISHVQNFDDRTHFVTTRHHLERAPLPVGITTDLQQAFFIQVQGEGVWCPDTHYYAEYFDNLDLSGAPVAALCEPDVPNWQWHSCCGGVPPPLSSIQGMLSGDSTLFSARWTTRIHSKQEVTFRVSSHASGGSRIFIGDVTGSVITTALDTWEKWGSIAISDTVTIGPGYHYLTYEYRSAETTDAIPTNSYAELAWLNYDDSATIDSAANMTDLPSVELFADVGWLACSVGSGAMQTSFLQAGFQGVMAGLQATVVFGTSFDTAPLVFASLFSTDKKSGHLRLLEASEDHTSIAVEFDTCNVIVDDSDNTFAWVAIASPDGVPAHTTAILQQPTNTSDMIALLAIKNALGLPEYLQWQNGSDPCRDRWAGVECRTFGGAPRVVVLDVRLVLSQTPK